MASNLEAMKHLFENDRFATSSGMRLVELRPGFAKTRLQVEERHLNSIGTVQGGVIFTLADFAFGVAVKTGGKVAPAITRISHSSRQPDPAPFMLRQPRSPASEVVCLHGTGDQRAGELVALFQGTAYITDESFIPDIAPNPE